MKSHLFRKLAGHHKISLYLLARYGEKVQENPEATMGPLMQELYEEVYGIVPEEQDLVAICERIIAHGEEVAKKSEEKAEKPAQPQRKRPTSPARNFSDYYTEALNGLDVTQTLLWLTDFDSEEAQRLYLQEDFELVECMIDTKMKLSYEENRIRYEAVLFGFGGKYSGSGTGSKRDEGEIRVHDMSEMTAADALAKIQAMQRRH